MNVMALAIWFFVSAISLAALWVSEFPHYLKVLLSPWILMGSGFIIWNLLIKLCAGSGKGATRQVHGDPDESWPSTSSSGESGSGPANGRERVRAIPAEDRTPSPLREFVPTLTPEQILEIEYAADSYKFHYPEFRDAERMAQEGFKQL